MLSIPSTRSSPKDVARLKRAFLTAFLFTTFLWAIEILKYFFGLEVFKLGVHPQSLLGLIGVITAPLIHGSFEHLISNTPALLILGTILLYGYPRSCWLVLTAVWLIAELGVWFTARPVYHFGASGLTYGFMAFIFIIGILRRDRLAITLSLLVFFLYGTMIWGVFPHRPGVSFETHLWGGGLGVICAVLLRNYDPSPPQKRYSWEDEDEDDPYIGDDWNDADSKIENNEKAE
ncbi:MAG: rhomboid family intramembrane serine protease [Gammaproteobacteria bacterium]